MATIKDVAKKASVGLETVSRVLNGSGPVNSETREKIFTLYQVYGKLNCKSFLKRFIGIKSFCILIK